MKFFFLRMRQLSLNVNYLGHLEDSKIFKHTVLDTIDAQFPKTALDLSDRSKKNLLFLKKISSYYDCSNRFRYSSIKITLNRKEPFLNQINQRHKRDEKIGKNTIKFASNILKRHVKLYYFEIFLNLAISRVSSEYCLNMRPQIEHIFNFW